MFVLNGARMEWDEESVQVQIALKVGSLVTRSSLVFIPNDSVPALPTHPAGQFEVKFSSFPTQLTKSLLTHDLQECTG